MEFSQDRLDAHPLWSFAVRIVIAVGITALAYLLWRIRHTVLMAFGAVIVAVLLLALARLLRRYLPLGQRWAVAMAVLLVAAVVIGAGWGMGAQVQSQFRELWQELPRGVQSFERLIGTPLVGGGGSSAGGEGTAGVMTPVASRLADWIASYGIPILDAVVGTLLVLIAGVFLAAQPDLYRRGAAKLFPPRQQERVAETMGDMGRALRLWLIGELIAMVIIGVLVGLGTWAIGLPVPLALGLFAGLTEFVPIIGPIVGAIPALLVALSQGTNTVLWTLLLFVVVQQLESNVIAPLVQERMVTLPPALFLLAVVGFGALFGILGVVFAAPLVVVVYVAVQKLWVREALHQETQVAGEAWR